MVHPPPVVLELTVSEIVVVAVSVPEDPVIVMLDVPAVAEALAVSVSRLLPVVGLVANAAVTPLGRPVATRFTLPVNPFTSLTEMVSFTLPPWVTDVLVADAASVKVGVEPVTVMVNASVLVQEPLL